MNEFLEIVKKFGFNSQNKTFVELMQQIDQDGNGTIDFDEFLQLMLNSRHEEQSLQKIFKFFDSDNTGCI